MKKIVIGSYLLLLLTFPAFTQRFNGGIFIGGLVSQVDGDTWSGYHKFGYLAGGLVSLKVTPHSSFQMELQYIQKGSKNVDTLGVFNYLLRLHYIELPVLYQYTFAKRFSFEIGPAMDVTMGSTEQLSGADLPNPVSLKPVTLSGILGFSGFITKNLKATARFNYSLISIRNGTANGYRKILFELGQYNNVLSFSLYWYFKKNEL